MNIPTPPTKEAGPLAILYPLLARIRCRLMPGFAAAMMTLAAQAAWQTHTIQGLPAGARLGKLWARNPAEVYVWAYLDGPSPASWLYRGNGLNWTEVLSLPGHTPGSVFGTGTDEVFAAAASNGLWELRRSGDRGGIWSIESLPPVLGANALVDISGTPNNVQVNDSGGHIFRYDGNQWTTVFNDPADLVYVQSVFGASEGYYVTCWGWGNWDGASWSFHQQGFDFCDIYGLWGIRDPSNALHLYAVGNNNFSNGIRVWKFDTTGQSFGGKQGFVFSDGDAFNIGTATGVWGSAADDVYVIGGLAPASNGQRTGRVYHYDGSTWTRLFTGDNLAYPGGISGSSSDNVWITFSDGRILHSGPVAAPTIVEHPSDLTVNTGESGRLSVRAEGTAPLGFQWYHDAGTPVPGATTSELITSPLFSSVSYWARVTNPFGFADSQVATIRVRLVPIISAQPEDTTINPGRSAELAVLASGAEPITYQWFRGTSGITNEPVVGAVGRTLTTPPSTTATSFWVRVSNPAGFVDSRTANVAIRLPPAILQQPQDVTVGEGAAARFTLTVSEMPDLLYQWQFNRLDLFGQTESTLVIPEVNLSHAGLYRVVVRNEAGSVTSLDAHLTVGGRPAIALQPLGLTVVLGQSATFGVGAVGTSPLHFQWRRNGIDLPGANGEQLVLPTTSESDAGEYTVFVDNAFGATVSAAARLDFIRAPAISVQPRTVQALEGDYVAFEVQATGSDLGYQWTKNGNAIPGAIDPVLVISAVAQADAGSYSVQVANLAGSVVSEPVTLAVTERMRLSGQPTSVRVPEGQRIEFSVQIASLGPFVYQWRLNGQNIPPEVNATATSATLVIESVSRADAGDYSVVVAARGQAVTSDPARLEVEGITPAPPRDNFASALVVIGSGTSVLSNVGATAEPGEPRHAFKPGGRSLWFQWQAPFNGRLRLDTVGSSFDTLLAVYTGNSLADLVPVAANDDAGGFFTSALEINVKRGVNYRIAADGLGGAEGDLVLAWDYTPSAPPVPEILNQPQGLTAPEGSRVELTVSAFDATSFQWYRHDIPLQGETRPALVFDPYTANDVGTYRVRVRGVGGEVSSDPAILELGANTTVRSTDKLAELLATAAVPEASPVTLQSLRKIQQGPLGSVPLWIVHAGAPSSHTFDNTSATTDPNDPSQSVYISQKSSWFWLDLHDTGELVIDARRAAFPVLLELYPTDDVKRAQSLSTNGYLRQTIRTPSSHILKVDGYGLRDFGLIPLEVYVGRPPVSRTNPTWIWLPIRRLLSEKPLVLTATNEPIWPIAAFQWWRQDQRLDGETNGSLRIAAGASPEAAGLYSVSIANELWQVTNLVAQLEVPIEPRLVIDPPRSPRFDGNSFVFGLTGNPGQRVAVESTLQVSADWQTRTQLWMTTTSGTNLVTDAPLEPANSRFYRAIEVPWKALRVGELNQGTNRLWRWRVEGGRLGLPFMVESTILGRTTSLSTNVTQTEPFQFETPEGAIISIAPFLP